MFSSPLHGQTECGNIKCSSVRRLFAAFMIFVSTASAGLAQQATDAVAPEFGKARSANKIVHGKDQMIAAAHPDAAKAGMAMLNKGGSAIDAMIATQLVLGLVEPQSSGLGGGAFLVYHDAENGTATTFDGRETAPLAADGNLFIGPDGEAMKFFDAVIGGRSVGTPGTVALMETAHQKFGKLTWAELFDPAIKLASDGFLVSARLNQSIIGSAESLFSNDAARAYFFSEEGVPIFEGTKLKNLAYARTLKAIAKDGAKAFYSSEIATDIIKEIQSSSNPGVLSLDDFAAYHVVEREPVCFEYRTYNICGMGPPSSGALTLGQIFGMLEKHDLKKLGITSAESWRLIGEASRLAFADRGRYMADADFVKMPKGLLNREYLKDRAKQFDHDAVDGKALDTPVVQPGNPPTDHSFLFADDNAIELPSTSHFSIVDKDGNVVSMTTTIENGFGSRIMVHGFLLNNELTDFSFTPEIGGLPVANRIEPGKRPRSSMAPTIVYKDGKPWAVIGSPGGSRIIGFVAKTLIAMIDWDMDVQAAIDLPHLVNRFGTYDVEENTAAEDFAPALAAMGYKVQSRNLNSGLHGIVINGNSLSGGADPRREGIVLGN